MNITYLKNDLKKIIMHESNFLIDYGFNFKFIIAEPIEDLGRDEFLRIENNHVMIDIHYYVFVDCKMIYLYVSRKSEVGAFKFREYLKYKGKDQNILKGPLDQSDKDYIKYFFSLFKQAIDDDLKAVLNGSTWLDLPVDRSYRD